MKAVGSSRFQPGEGPSRGLLRDYEPSDLLRMELFEALVTAQLAAAVPALPGHHLQESQTLTTSIHPTMVAFILHTSYIYRA